MVGPANALDTKLVRDLWRIRGQVMAIALVIAVGVLLLVMNTGLVNSLQETKRAYYERYRIADIFAPVTRAPHSVLAQIEALPGVARATGRVRGSALIDLPDEAAPIFAHAVSLPADQPPRLNDVYLAAGRPLDPRRADEVLLLKAFADARGLVPGDTLAANMHGVQRRFTIVGLAQSPEFLYVTPPGEMLPDDRRLAVLWLSEAALEAAFDMRGAVNEFLIDRAAGIDERALLTQLDRALKPYGGLGAYALTDHLSDRFVQEEINGLKVSTRVVPPVFLAVAAFLLYMVMTRILESERQQIGLLKAFGYTAFEVVAHYGKLIVIVALVGASLGCLLGVWAGHALVDVYLLYYKFPFLVFELDPRSFVMAYLVSVLAASAGGLWVLRRVLELAPAAAMQPPAPVDYRRARHFGALLQRWLDQPSRMVLRRLMRQPVRAALATLGIAAGMALSVAMLGVLSGFDQTFALNFDAVDRSDATVTFVEPQSDRVLLELAKMPAVVAVEPVRVVPVILRHGVLNYRGAVQGLVVTPHFYRVLDTQLRSLSLTGEGLIVSQPLAGLLGLQVGDRVLLDVREGRRAQVEVAVVGIAQTLLGAPAFMNIDSLNRLLNEPGRVSGAFLRIDSTAQAQLYARLKNLPAVAGVTIKASSRRAFKTMMDQGAGAMRYIMLAVAGIITFGIVYNSARIAYAERARDLACLRVVGFTRVETAFVLLGELMIITLLALPLGCALGYGLSQLIALGFSTDLYQIPAAVGARDIGVATVAVLVALVCSGYLVQRDIAGLDLASALKVRE